VCALRLARAGVPVTVLEQADHPGGAVHTAPLTLPGFVHDVCAGFMPLTLASPAFDDLGVREAIEWVNPPVAMAHPFADGSAIGLHRDVDATADDLEAFAAGAGRAWQALVRPLAAQRDDVLQAALTPFPPVAPAARLALRLRRDAIDLARLMAGSSATAGLELFGDERAAAWLAGSAMHADLTPGASPGGGFALGLQLLGHLAGWGFPRGGAGRLVDALTAGIEAAAGTVRCEAPVERVLVRRNRVAGVRVRGGEEIACDTVVLSTSAGLVADLLEDGALPARLMTRLRRWRYGLGTFKADWALSGPVPWTSATARQAGVVHLGDTLGHLFASHQQAGAGRVPDEPSMVVGQHTLHDATRAPEGRHTLYAYAHVPQRLDVPDHEVLARMERRLEAFAPGFGELVLARATHSPADLERENPSMRGGDLAGGSCEIDQQLIFRPAPEMVRGRTPLRGLYVAGPSVHPGAGVHGVSGTAAARAVLADRRLPRRVVRGLAAGYV